MAAADVLTPDEIQQALSLQKITQKKSHCDQPLFVQVMDALLQPENLSTGTQTEPEGAGASLDEKLQACVVPNDHQDRRTAEERMLQFQARCEAVVRREAEAELARIRMLEREQIALEEAAKSRAELQEAMSKIKLELCEREERLRHRERLATERFRTKELELEKKAVEWRGAAQRVVDEEQQRQSTRAKHLSVEEKRLQILQQGLERKEQELTHAEARNVATEQDFSRRLQEAQDAAKLSAEKAVAQEREALQQLRLVLEREKLQVDATRAQQEACNDRLVSEGTQMQTGLNQEWWKAAVQASAQTALHRKKRLSIVASGLWVQWTSEWDSCSKKRSI